MKYMFSVRRTHTLTIVALRVVIAGEISMNYCHLVRDFKFYVFKLTIYFFT